MLVAKRFIFEQKLRLPINREVFWGYYQNFG